MTNPPPTERLACRPPWNSVSRVILLTVVVLAWLPTTSEAACKVTCECYDTLGNSGSETQGPFQSKAACINAANEMSNRCTSADPNLMASCTGCTNCEPSATSTGSTGTSQANQQAAEEEAQKQKAAEMARQQRAFEQQKSQLLGTMKGVSPSAPANVIALKPAPPPRSRSRRQLDCSVRSHSKAGWDSASNDCAPITPRVPEPPNPTAVETPDSPAQWAQYLGKLDKRIASSRKSIAKQDNEIAKKKYEIGQLELKSAGDPKKPAGGSDALARALAALEKAKADRARTAEELSKLEQQETEAKKRMASQAQ